MLLLRQLRQCQAGLWSSLVNSGLQSSLANAGLWLLIICAAACGTDRFIAVGMARAPSVAGWVDAEKTEDGAQLTLRLEHLHPAEHVDPELHAYVVWIDDGKQPAVRAGVLTYRPERRLGQASVHSPYRKFIVKVTAEANDTPSAPSDFVVVSEQISTDN
jgi:hypothetical protein